MDIQEWISNARQSNYSDDEIRSQLKSAGWADDQINTVITPKASAQHSNKNLLLVLIAVVILLGGAAAAYFFYFKKEDASLSNSNTNNVQNANTSKTAVNNTNASSNTNSAQSNANNNANTNTTVANTNTPTSTVSTADWKTHTNEEYAFSFKYPSDFFYFDIDSDPNISPSEPIYGANVQYDLSDDCLVRAFEELTIPADCYSIGVSLEKKEKYTPIETAEEGDWVTTLLSQKVTTVAGHGAIEKTASEKWGDGEKYFTRVVYTTDEIQSPQGEGLIVYEIAVAYGKDAEDEALEVFDEVIKSFTISAK